MSEIMPVVVVEKDALSGVLSPICNRWGIPFISAHGNPSISVLKDLIEIMRTRQLKRKRIKLLHFTDHDPAGTISMVNQLNDSEGNFAHMVGDELWNYDLDNYSRVGLTMEQVKHYGLPPNQLKEDSQGAVTFAAEYKAKYGDKSWELDALGVSDIEEIANSEIEKYVDADVWAECSRSENAVHAEYSERMEKIREWYANN